MSITFSGGSTIIPFPAAEYASQKARDMRADLVIGDEFDDIDIGVHDAVAKPWLSEPWSLGLVVGAGTPRRGRHGLLWRNFERGRKDGTEKYFSSHATHADVPEFVSTDAVAEEKANLPPETFAGEWEANFDAGEGLVYSFQPDFHIRTPPPLNAFNSFICGVDWGWTDPAVILLIGLQGHGNDAVAWVLDELYEPQLPDHAFEAKAKSWGFS